MKDRSKEPKSRSRLWVPLLVFALLVAGFFVFMQSLAKKEMPREAAKVLTADEMPWLDLAVVPGALRAVLWGDAASGAYGACIFFSEQPGPFDFNRVTSPKK